MANISTTSIKLEPEMKDRVKRLADARRRTSHWLMREAVAQYVEREEQREQMKQATLAAWEHYAATGLHVSADKADTWLAELENKKKAKSPKCHR